MINPGDIVKRLSYGGDIYFKVVELLSDGTVMLAGINFRIMVDAPIEDLEKVTKKDMEEYRDVVINEADEKLLVVMNSRQSNRETKEIKAAEKKDEKDEEEEGEVISIPGKVLHIDGDEQFLKMCLKYYEKLAVPVVGELVPEKKQPEVIQTLLKKHTPDIVVITGHDSFYGADKKNINSYRTSKYFVETVKLARAFQCSKDSLIVFAGACQSYYEALIQAGANFAASPKRVLIHALDPVLLAHKISYSSFEEILDSRLVAGDTITGLKGIGGFQSRGTHRYATTGISG